MQSMTGYGRAARQMDGREITIELKSVNHRFLDLGFRMPRSFMFMEDDMRKLISSRLSRGHVDIFVTYKNTRSDAKAVRLDKSLMDAYVSALSEAEGLENDMTLMKVASFPDVLTVVEADEDEDALRELMKLTLSDALDAISAMRRREGAEIAVSLAAQTDELERITLAIEKRYPDTVNEYTARLRAAIEDLIGQKVDETRLLTEVAVMADRSAIDEEIVRLKSHISQMREAFTSAEGVGRRVDFIVQELNREVNTISSKSQDIPITNLVVSGKAVIEKLREQIQNIE